MRVDHMFVVGVVAVCCFGCGQSGRASSNQSPSAETKTATTETNTPRNDQSLAKESGGNGTLPAGGKQGTTDHSGSGQIGSEPVDVATGLPSPSDTLQAAPISDTMAVIPSGPAKRVVMPIRRGTLPRPMGH